MIDQDKACPHLTFEARVAVNRLLKEGSKEEVVEGYSADIKISCIDCDEPFRFIGVPAGLNPTKPTCSADETELHAPIRPASSDPDFGLGLPGFAIRFKGN